MGLHAAIQHAEGGGAAHHLRRSQALSSPKIWNRSTSTCAKSASRVGIQRLHPLRALDILARMLLARGMSELFEFTRCGEAVGLLASPCRWLATLLRPPLSQLPLVQHAFALRSCVRVTAALLASSCRWVSSHLVPACPSPDTGYIVHMTMREVVDVT